MRKRKIEGFCKMMPRRLLILAAFALPASLPAAAQSEIPVPKLTWEACPAAPKGSAPTDGLLCSTATVPMDYDNAGAGSFMLALIKAPATDRTGKLGTIFWNPGGPSDAGTEFLPALIGGFSERLRARFDIVSWDPRGMGGRTTPVVQCFDSAEEEATFLGTHIAGSLPVTAEAMAIDTAGRKALNEACIKRNGDLLAHVSTADNARDLDLLRQAVGEEQMNYYGTSYGTFLGATYINMFPDRVRAAVLDGAVAPSGWAGNDGEDLTLTTFIRVGSDFGGALVIGEFMNQCGAVDTKSCAFSAGSPEATRHKWTELLKRAKPGIVLDGDTIDEPSVLGYLGSTVYIVDPVPGFARFPGWVAVGQFLQALWEASEKPAKTPAPADSKPADAAAAPAKPVAPAPYITSVGRQLSVICGESPNPQTEPEVAAQIKRSYDRAGISGWPFVASCAGWTAKAKNTYLGPWNKPTKGPVLVIGNTFDPATAFPSSVRMAHELANGHLLVVNGFGHTVLGNPSTCAKDYVADYYIDGRLPPFGAECRQDKAPFPGG